MCGAGRRYARGAHRCSGAVTRERVRLDAKRRRRRGSAETRVRGRGGTWGARGNAGSEGDARRARAEWGCPRIVEPPRDTPRPASASSSSTIRENDHERVEAHRPRCDRGPRRLRRQPALGRGRRLPRPAQHGRRARLAPGGASVAQQGRAQRGWVARRGHRGRRQGDRRDEPRLRLRRHARSRCPFAVARRALRGRRALLPAGRPRAVRDLLPCPPRTRIPVRRGRHPFRPPSPCGSAAPRCGSPCKVFGRA